MLKRLSVIVVLVLPFSCITATSQNAATQQSEHRKTSTPYSGDLSIFDSPGRDERLQIINRVMDILGISPGKAVADIGAGSGWCTVRAAKRVGTPEPCMRSISIPRPFVTLSPGCEREPVQRQADMGQA